MPKDFIPSREADLVTWLSTFGSVATAAPTTFGLTAGQCTTFTTLATTFSDLYAQSQAQGTRTPMVIIQKDQAKANVIANARVLAGIVQKFPGITNAQRAELGLTVHVQPGPVPAPGAAPGILVLSQDGRTIRIRLIDPENPTRRSKPPGVSGATVMSYVGATPPDSADGWKFEGSITKTQFDVVFPSTVAAGTKVWITAFWFNPRSQSGPAAPPVSAFLQFGGDLPMAA